MTVTELIAQLAKLPPDMHVVVERIDGAITPPSLYVQDDLASDGYPTPVLML